MSLSLWAAHAQARETQAVTKPKRALLETGAILGIGLVWYGIDYVGKERDGEFRFSTKTFRRKLLSPDGTRFDTSSPFHNGVGHAVVGGLYYNAWRANGFTAWESFWAAAAVGLVWEYLVEFREVASINDLIVTNFGGLAFGEATHQMATALTNATDSIATTAAAAFFDPWLVLNRGIDNAERRPEFLDNADWQFAMTAGGGAANYQHNVELRYETELSIYNRLVRPGEGWTLGPLDTELFVRLALSLSLTSRLELYAKSQWLGFQWRNQPGRYVSLGVSTDVTLDIHPFPQNRDFVTSITPVALSLSAWRSTGPLQWRFSGSVAPCFGVVHSIAVGAYREEHDLSGTKTTLREHGYYYAYGLAARAWLTLSWEQFELLGLGRYAAFRSIQGLDRRQANLTDDFALRDQRLGVSVAGRVWLRHWALELAWDRYDARGAIINTVRQVEDRFFLRALWGVRG